MKQLSTLSLSQVSGGVLYKDGHTLDIPSYGIPTTAFNQIEYAMQMAFNGAWSPEQSIQYLENTYADEYLDYYFVNVLSGMKVN